MACSVEMKRVTQRSNLSDFLKNYIWSITPPPSNYYLYS